VEQFGGEIDYRSEYGVGSTFFFTIDVSSKAEKAVSKTVSKLSSHMEATSQIWMDDRISTLHLDLRIPILNVNQLPSIESESVSGGTDRSLAREQATSAAGSQSPPCILIVDDNDFNQFTLTQMISMHHGFTCDTAYNGVEAVRLVKGGTNYKLIFMDINMPVMDGFEASSLIKEHYRGTGEDCPPIVALTGY